MPQVASVAPVKVESLAEFLLANETAVAQLLAEDEVWMAQNLWHYSPRPDNLAFTVTGNSQDVVERFVKAIRVNPNAKFALYIQGMPGTDLIGAPRLPEDISVFQDHGHLNHLPLQALTSGELVSAVDVVVSANDEPDHGHDIGLFTDSGTDHGQEYGFGEQPFGNPNLEYGSQAPFHMGFYHESPVLYALGGFLKETYPQMRIHQYKRLAELAFAKGHDYWGYRFMGWGLHYIGDFSNPYHVTPVPGNSTLSTIWVGLLSTLGFPQAQQDAVQLVSNRHTVLEDFQSVVMTKAYEANNLQHPMISALTVEQPIAPYAESDVIDKFARASMDKADYVGEILMASFPREYVQDETVEYSNLDALETLEQTVHQHAGEDGFNQLEATISGLLSDFSIHGSAYVADILRAKP
ncbi:MAG: hypothetical protein CL679_14700 [Bermanella sp.]|nr:hypothetical protein [Bermanella sp.]|tara:strand:+ start:1099 stop:2325 length:1227 start_codon:yes stop_codon:yes gene_type:complete